MFPIGRHALLLGFVILVPALLSLAQCAAARLEPQTSVQTEAG